MKKLIACYLYTLRSNALCNLIWLLCYLLARDNKEDEILLFHEVLDNIAKVDKVLSQPGGSLVMAGRSGVGRRTAVSLVAHMHQITIMSPKVSRAYGLKQFKNDLKAVSSQYSKFNIQI